MRREGAPFDGGEAAVAAMEFGVSSPLAKGEECYQMMRLVVGCGYPEGGRGKECG